MYQQQVVRLECLYPFQCVSSGQLRSAIVVSTEQDVCIVHDVLHRLKMTRITKMMKKKKLLLLLMMIIVYCLYLLIHLHHVGLMYLYLDIYLSSILTVQYVISYKHI